MTETATPTISGNTSDENKFSAVDKILADPWIMNLTKTNPSCREGIERAAELLQNKRDAVDAVRKAAQALITGKVRVFLSYKKNEEQTAKSVAGALLSATNELEISYMAEMPHGIKYRDWIDEETARAHWFILLLPDPGKDWDWCLFESGLFKARMLSCDKLICLYHPNVADRPGELDEFNNIPVNYDSVFAFLKEILHKPDALPGMNPLNENADIDSIANKIVNAVSPPSEKLITRYLRPCVTLEVTDPKAMATLDGLKNARLDYVQEDVPGLFGKIDTPRTWGELIANQCKDDDCPAWLTDLGQNIASAMAGNRFEPSLATFATPQGNAMYRANVFGITRSATGEPKSIHILFNESYSAINLSPEHKSIAALAILLRMAFRFRWEILEKYGRGMLKSDDINALHENLDRMQAEARASSMQPQGMLDLFDSNEQKKVIIMLAKWNEMRNEEGTGTLDLALRDNDVKRTGELLEELSPINRDFLIMASRRFTELNEQITA